MNEEQKNVNSTNDNNDNNESKKQQKRNQDKNIVGRHRFTGILVICAVIFVTVFAVVNAKSISDFASGIVSVLTPVILGFALAYLLNPMLKFFEKKVFKWIKIRPLLRGISLFFTYLVTAGVLVAIVFLIVPEFLSNLSLFISKFDEYIDKTIAVVNGWIADYFGTHHVPDAIKKEDLLTAVSQFFTESGDLFQEIGTYVVEYGKGIFIGLKNALLAVFISIYVLISKERLFAQGNKICTAALSKNAQERFYRYIRICDKTFGGFIVGKIIDSLIIGVITLIALMIFDIPYGILVAAIVCVTNVIPVFGPFIGAIPSFFIIFIVDPTKAFIFLILILIIQQLDGNVIGPKILGNSTGMSSLGVIISIIVMGEWFGVIGMIIGVPLFAVALTLINEFAENSLRKKNLPLNSAEYYSDESFADTYEDKRRPSQKFFSYAGSLFGKVMKVVFHKNQNNNGNKEEKEEKKEESNNE